MLCSQLHCIKGFQSKHFSEGEGEGEDLSEAVLELQGAVAAVTRRTQGVQDFWRLGLRTFGT